MNTERNNESSFLSGELENDYISSPSNSKLHYDQIPEINRSFIFEKKRIVVLICDFYEKKHFPKKFRSEVSNIALWPISNIFMIDHVLRDLYTKNFKRIVLAGRHINEVIDYVANSRHMKRMVFACLTQTYTGLTAHPLNSEADIFRALKIYGLDNDFLVIKMNQLCFIDFDYLFNQNKNALATFLLYEKDSNDPERYYYVLDNNQIMNCFLFPLKCQSEVTRVFNAVPLSSPTIFVASSELNNLFAELYWVENINQLVHDSIDLNMNKYPFNFVDNCNVAYCKEIVTMNDYLSVNCDLPESLNAVNLFSSSVSNLNLERFEKYLHWIVIDDAEPRIVFKDSLIFNDFNYVITINDVVIRKEKKKVEGFFEKLENFLMEKYFSKNSVDYCEVAAKVLSFKISNSYKANKFEIVDVFASFLAKSVFRKTEIVNDLNIAIARAVEFFTVLQEIVANDRECQEHFMDLLEEYILGSNFKQKYLLFASYIHLFQERKVIKRKVLLQHVGAIQGKI